MVVFTTDENKAFELWGWDGYETIEIKEGLSVHFSLLPFVIILAVAFFALMVAVVGLLTAGFLGSELLVTAFTALGLVATWLLVLIGMPAMILVIFG